MNRLKGMALLAITLLLLTACGKSTEQQIVEQLELGQKYLAEMNYEQAIVAFNKVIEIDAKQIDAYIGLADAYGASGQTDKKWESLEAGYAVWKDIGQDEDKQSFLEYYIMAILEDENSYDDNFLEELLQKYEAVSGNHDLRALVEEENGESEEQGQENIVILSEDSGDYQDLEVLYNSEDYDSLFHQVMDSGEIDELVREHAGEMCYIGESQGNVPNGFGLMIYGEGVKNRTILYIGDWIQGVRDGKGLAVWRDPSGSQGIYVGGWKNDIEDGEALERTYQQSGRTTDYIGTAQNGIAEGELRYIYVNLGTNIEGYVYQCREGVPQSYGIQTTSIGDVEEEIMALMIDESGELLPVWHPWAGLHCASCVDTGDLDFLNRFDHSFAGWGDNPEVFTFTNAD